MLDYDAARAIAEDHLHVLVDLMGPLRGLSLESCSSSPRRLS
jgi:hypothetical protein